MAGRNNFVCIEIGPVFVRLVEMKGSGKRFTVLNTAEYRMPQGLYVDGYFQDHPEMSRFLENCLVRSGIGSRNAVFSMVSNKIVSRDIEIPMVKQSQLAELIDAQATDYFPMDISEYDLSYSVMKTDKAEKKMELMLYAVPEDMISGIYDVASLTGLKIKSIEYSGHASFSYLKKSKVEGNAMLLQLNEETTLASIISDGVMTLQRTINYGTADLQDAAIVSGLANDHDEAYDRLCSAAYVNPYLPGNPAFMESMTEEERQAYQKTIGVGDGVSKKLSEEEAAALAEEVRVKIRSLSDGEMAEVKENVTESARQLIANVVRLIEYNISRDKDRQTDRIILADRGEYIQGLAELLKNETGLEVVTAGSLKGRGLLNGTINSRRPSCFVTLAAAAFEPLDFRIAEQKNQEKRSGENKKYLMILLLVAVLCAVMIAVVMLRYAGLKHDKARLEAQRDELSSIQEIYNDYEKSMNVNSEVHAIDTSTDRMNEYLTKVFAELENKLPSSTVITSMNSSGDVLTMSMKVSSKEAAAKLLMELKDIEYFSDVQISGLTDTKDETTGARAVEFTVTCYYNTDLGFEFNQAMDGASAEAAGAAGGENAGAAAENDSTAAGGTGEGVQ